jgi:hypothetical protein
VIERSERAGIMNFFERWSRKKQVSRHIHVRSKKED